MTEPIAKTWPNWAIDAALSSPDEHMFCFVPIEGDEVVFGMNFVADKCPGALVAILHPGGQEACEAWADRHRDAIEETTKP